MNLIENFEKAKLDVLTLTSKPSNEVMLNLYALNKQASIGDINIEAPKMFDFVAQAKFNAWKSRAGMSQEQAMQAYVELVNELLK